METRRESFISYALPHRESTGDGLQATSRPRRPGDADTERHPEREPTSPPIRTQAIPEHGERPPSRERPPLRTQAIPEHPERPPRG